MSDLGQTQDLLALNSGFLPGLPRNYYMGFKPHLFPTCLLAHLSLLLAHVGALDLLVEVRLAQVDVLDASVSVLDSGRIAWFSVG